MRIKIQWWYWFIIFGYFSTWCYSAMLPEYGGTYRTALPGQVGTFDPARGYSPAERWLVMNLYDRLIALNNQNLPIPGLAESWSISADGLTWTFTLRTTARFHTGKPVTAESVKFSIERLVNPTLRAPKSWLFSSVSGYREYLSGQATQITGIIVTNSRTIQFRLLKPNSNFLYALLSPAASIVSPEDSAAIDTHPIGSGPFIFAEATTPFIRLTANPEYWEGRPYLDNIQFYFSDNPTSDLLEFELGNLDVCSVPEAEFHRIDEHPQWQSLLIPINTPNIGYLGFNLTKAPMTDLAFRQAFKYGIDRKGILEIVLNNHGTLSASLLANLQPDSEFYAYSLSSAQLMVQRFPKRMLGLIVNQEEYAAYLIAQRIQSNFLAAGYPIRVEQLPAKEYSQRIREGNYDLFYCHYFADNPDPEIILQTLLLEKNFGIEGNQSFYYHPQLETILNAAKSADDESERTTRLLRVEKIIQQDIPLIPFFQVTPYFIRQPEVENLDQSAYRYHELKNVWLNKLMERSTITKSGN
ncbi:MAG: ABC transporter substrate-binding protein [bacterium]